LQNGSYFYQEIRSNSKLTNIVEVLHDVLVHVKDVLKHLSFLHDVLIHVNTFRYMHAKKHLQHFLKHVK
jgi:hypothetical protein